MRALYGLVVSGVIGVLVTLVTKPRPDQEIEGLVIGTISWARERFKGGPVNEEEGKPIVGFLVEAAGERSLSLHREEMERLKARIGDLLYVADSRRWLGGLRSVHAKLTAAHEGPSDEIRITPDLIAEGELLAYRRHRVEKIF